MPTFLDRHDFQGVSPADIALAHVMDLEVQGKYNVRYLSYWFDYDRQTAFCLVDAPGEEAAEAVHRESHGDVANRIIQVDPTSLNDLLGRFPEAPAGQPYIESAFRTILFTDMVGSTALTQQLGDASAMRALRRHDEIVRQSLQAFNGKEVKHTGDGIMASFASVSRTVECAIAIQRRITEDDASAEQITLRVGASAGEPVTEHDDLFGAAVQVAARLCAKADPGGILVSSAVRDLAIGKGFVFSDQGVLVLRGFEEPVHAYAVEWRPDRVG